MSALNQTVFSESILFQVISPDGYQKTKVVVNIEAKFRDDCVDYRDLLPTSSYVFSFTGTITYYAKTRKGNFRSVGSSYGQILDELKKLNVNSRELDELIKLWENWHLNDMVPGLYLQEQIIQKEIKGEYSYDQAVEILKKHNMQTMNGYTYGTRWLTKVADKDTFDKIISKIRLIKSKLNSQTIMEEQCQK